MGATPTSFAISARLSFPSSGNSARSVLIVTAPIPLTDSMISTLRALTVSAWTHLAKRSLIVLTCFFSVSRNRFRVKQPLIAPWHLCFHAIQWALWDLHGSVRDVAVHDTSAGGNTSIPSGNHRVFDSFGTPVAPITDGVLFGYTGREFDASTGLQYNRARWYDPAVGRFVSEDPSGFSAGGYESQSVWVEQSGDGCCPVGEQLAQFAVAPRLAGGK